jgi:hypothetical protein
MKPFGFGSVIVLCRLAFDFPHFQRYRPHKRCRRSNRPLPISAQFARSGAVYRRQYGGLFWVTSSLSVALFLVVAFLLP